MKHCTHAAMRSGNCREVATLQLTWTTRIRQGWDVSVTRAYCETHGMETMRNLGRAGTAVIIEEMTTSANGRAAFVPA